MSTKDWSRGDIIGVAGIFIAVLACVAAVIVVPEVRSWLGLERLSPRNPVEASIQPTPELNKPASSETTSATSSDSSSRPAIPKFEGAVGHLDEGTKFVDFIYGNQSKIVFLDIYIQEEQFDGDLEEPNAYFVIFDDCDELPSNETPSTSACTGVEYNINNTGKSTDYGFYYSRGVYKLHGYFAITGVDGPHQGLMGVGMKPLNYESVASAIIR